MEHLRKICEFMSFLTWEWFLEQLVIWLVFSVLVSCILHCLRIRKEKKDRAPFEDWHLVLLGEDDPGEHQSLHWEEVRRVLDSDFERWKLVKSVVAGTCWLSVTRITPAEQAGWTYADRAKRQLVIDFNEIPPEHMENGRWAKPPKNLRADAKCPCEDKSPSERN